MKKKMADELKECAAMAKLARENVIALQWWAQYAERELWVISDSIESLPKFEDIDVFNRRHYLCKNIRKRISGIIDTFDYADIASEAFKKAMVDLDKNVQGPLCQVEAEIQNHSP